MCLNLSSEVPPSTLIYFGRQTFFYAVKSCLKPNIILDKVNKFDAIKVSSLITNVKSYIYCEVFEYYIL
jgi:hypothetical protein